MYREVWHDRDEPPELIAEDPFVCGLCEGEFDEDEELRCFFDDERVCAECFSEMEDDDEGSYVD